MADLRAALKGDGPFTVFAPTNAAFAAVPNIAAILKDIPELTKILKYHVVAGEVLSSQLKDGEQVQTLEGQKVNITISGSDVSVDKAKVVKANVVAGNGVIHVIDAVLIPPATPSPAPPRSNDLVTLAGNTKDLSTLVTALTDAGLVDTLTGAGPFTVFAPSNEAFNALPAAQLTYLLNTKDELQKVLKNHVVSGDVKSGDLKNDEEVKTLEGAKVTVAITTDANATTIKINDATVTTPNVEASNGVVHIINKVLLPPGFKIPSIPEVAAEANFTTLMTAL